MASTHNHCCDILEIICTCNHEELAQLIQFLYDGKIVIENTPESIEIALKNITKILGFPQDILTKFQMKTRDGGTKEFEISETKIMNQKRHSLLDDKMHLLQDHKQGFEPAKDKQSPTDTEKDTVKTSKFTVKKALKKKNESPDMTNTTYNFEPLFSLDTQIKHKFNFLCHLCTNKTKIVTSTLNDRSSLKTHLKICHKKRDVKKFIQMEQNLGKQFNEIKIPKICGESFHQRGNFKKQKSLKHFVKQKAGKTEEAKINDLKNSDYFVEKCEKIISLKTENNEKPCNSRKLKSDLYDEKSEQHIDDLSFCATKTVEAKTENKSVANTDPIKEFNSNHNNFECKKSWWQ